MYEIRRSSDFGGGLVGAVLVLVLLGAFLSVVAVAFVVRTFVKYPGQQRKPLWIALAVCVGCSIGAGVVYLLTKFDGSPALVGIGVAVLLITCFAVDLKNRDTLLRENTSLIDSVLKSSWWGSEDKPRQEQEREQVAA